MKITLSVACIVVALAVVSAGSDAGHFIPKAFYTLDSDGHKSNLHPVSPHTAHYLRRLRRDTFSSSSSSSSVSSGDGGQIHFTSQQVVQQTPSEVGIASRFGGTTAGGSGDKKRPFTGHVVQTTGVVDKSGRVHYKTQEGHF